MFRNFIFVLICLFIFLYACGCGESRNGLNSIQDGLISITQGELETNLYYLTSDELTGRETGTAGQELAAKFISEKFSEYGFTPGGDSSGWTQAFSGGGKNVIGIMEGTSLKNEALIIGAHYDHLGEGYPGADDNGSGTVALIEIAEALSKIKAELKRTVILVAFSGEEEGLVGSKYYVSHPNMSDMVYMINLDMVGYLRNKDLDCLGAGSSTYVSKLIRDIAVTYPEIIPSISSSAGGGSDHVYFVRNGISSTFFHTGLHSNYHKPSDTPDKINYKGLTDISKLVFELSFHLTVDEQRPVKADLPAVLNDEIFRDHGVY